MIARPRPDPAARGPPPLSRRTMSPSGSRTQTSGTARFRKAFLPSRLAQQVLRREGGRGGNGCFSARIGGNFRGCMQSLSFGRLTAPASFPRRRGRQHPSSCAARARDRRAPAKPPRSRTADRRWPRAWQSRPAPRSSTSLSSSCAVRNFAARHVAEPSQPLMRRFAAHKFHRPSSPITMRPPGFSTRAISRTACSASGTKHSTVTATTASKLASGNGSARISPSTNATARPIASALARAAASMCGSASTPVISAPRPRERCRKRAIAAADVEDAQACRAIRQVRGLRFLRACR